METLVLSFRLNQVALFVSIVDFIINNHPQTIINIFKKWIIIIYMIMIHFVNVFMIMIKYVWTIKTNSLTTSSIHVLNITGIGGAGENAVNNMITHQLSGFISTIRPSLRQNKSSFSIVIFYFVLCFVKHMLMGYHIHHKIIKTA